MPPPEVLTQAAARGLTSRVSCQIGHLDAPAGGLEIHIELFRNGDQVAHLQVSPFVSPVAGPSRIHFRADLDRIPVLAEFHLVIFQHVLRPGAAFAFDLPQYLDGDLFAVGGFDFDGAAIGYDGEFAAGLDAIRLSEPVFHIARRQRGCRQ